MDVFTVAWKTSKIPAELTGEMMLELLVYSTCGKESFTPTTIEDVNRLVFFDVVTSQIDKLEPHEQIHWHTPENR